MQLRNAPLFGYRAWPPVWVRVKSADKSRKVLMGEIGVLKGVHEHRTLPGRLFLTVQFAREQYVGCLFMATPTAARLLLPIFKSKIGYSIKSVGDTEIDEFL